MNNLSATLPKIPGGLAIGTVDPPLVQDYLGHDRSGDYSLISSELDGKSWTASVNTKAVSKIWSAPTPTPDCTDAVASEHQRVKTAVLTAIEAL